MSKIMANHTTIMHKNIPFGNIHNAVHDSCKNLTTIMHNNNMDVTVQEHVNCRYIYLQSREKTE